VTVVVVIEFRVQWIDCRRCLEASVRGMTPPQFDASVN